MSNESIAACMDSETGAETNTLTPVGLDLGVRMHVKLINLELCGWQCIGFAYSGADDATACDNVSAGAHETLALLLPLTLRMCMGDGVT